VIVLRMVAEAYSLFSYLSVSDLLKRDATKGVDVIVLELVLN